MKEIAVDLPEEQRDAFILALVRSGYIVKQKEINGNVFICFQLPGNNVKDI